MTTPAQQASTDWLTWAHWLSLSLNLGCLLAGLGDLSLRNPFLVVLWLLGNGLVAAGRLSAHRVGPSERPWLKAFLWVGGLASPGLLWWALSANDDITFRDAQTTIRQHRTLSMDSEEEQVETRHYQTTYFLFEERVGTIESRPVQPGEQIGY
jgi:hypothetical protein